MGTALAKVTAQAADLTSLPSAVSRCLQICGRQMGKLRAPAGGREKAKLVKRCFCFVPCSSQVALCLSRAGVLLLSPPSTQQQHWTCLLRVCLFV